MWITEEMPVSEASLRTPAELDHLVEHLRESPVECGLGPQPQPVGPGHLTAHLPLNDLTWLPGGRASPLVMATGSRDRRPGRGRVGDATVRPRPVIVEPATDDVAQARVILDEAMINNRGSVHGGLLLGIAMRVQDAFLGDGGGQGLTLTARFLRPAVPDFGHLECRTGFVRPGSTFRTVRAQLLRPAGVVVPEATGTGVVPSRTEL